MIRQRRLPAIAGANEERNFKEVRDSAKITASIWNMHFTDDCLVEEAFFGLQLSILDHLFRRTYIRLNRSRLGTPEAKQGCAAHYESLVSPGSSGWHLQLLRP